VVEQRDPIGNPVGSSAKKTTFGTHHLKFNNGQEEAKFGHFKYQTTL
jgi:hypothetical protein